MWPTLAGLFLAAAGYYIFGPYGLFAFVLGAIIANGIQKYIRSGSLNEGDRAPDGPVFLLDGSEKTLLHFHKVHKPLVLMFGSFS